VEPLIVLRIVSHFGTFLKMKPGLKFLPLQLFLAVYLAIGAIGHLDLLRLVLHGGGWQECVAPPGKAPPAKPRPVLIQAKHIPASVKVATALTPADVQYGGHGLRLLFIAPSEPSTVRPLEPVLLPSRPRDPPSA
jgi:hypothetical protein